MSQSLVRPLILVLTTTFGGCATLEGAKQDAGSLWDKAKTAAAPAISNIPTTQAQAAAPAAQEKASTLNPTLEYVLDQEAAKKGKKINFGGTCSQQLAASAAGQKGPGPLNNPHNVGSVQNQVGNAVQGALNSATGGRDNIIARSLNTLGNTGIQVSDAVGRQWATVCSRVVELNNDANRADLSPVNSQTYTAQWQSIASRTPTVVTLALNTEKGATAMTTRGTNSVITDVSRRGLEKVIPTQQGVVPDFLQKLFK